MNKPIIFLDMDGVIADFPGGIGRRLGIHNSKGQLITKLEQFSIPLGQPDMEYWPEINSTTDEFKGILEELDYNFWSTLEKLPWADDLVSMADKFGEVYILSAPTHNPECHQGKIDWINKHYPHLSDKIILARDKHICAGPGKILVDDYHKKVDAFRMHGGSAILFPQHYNRNFVVLRYVEEDVKNIRLDYTRYCLESLIENKT